MEKKLLATNPNSLPALLLLAGSYVDDAKPGSLAKATTYAQKAIVVAKADDPDADKSRKLSAGVAHSIVGYAYIKARQNRSGDSGIESQRQDLLKGQDDQQYSVALYRLGFAYAKLNKVAEAREVLTEAVKIPGPVQADVPGSADQGECGAGEREVTADFKVSPTRRRASEPSWRDCGRVASRRRRWLSLTVP